MPPTPDVVASKENPGLAWANFVPSVEAPGEASVDCDVIFSLAFEALSELIGVWSL